MMSMPSITTWKFDDEEPLHLARCYSDEEGTVLLYSGDGRGSSYLALFPDEKIEIPLGPGCWEELERRLDDHFYVGYLTYEMGAYADRLTPHAPSKEGVLLFRPSVLIHFDHETKLATQYGQASLEKADSQDFSMYNLRTSDSMESYLEKIEILQEAMRAGDVYQVNLSRELIFDYQGSPFALFERVAPHHPYSAYLSCGHRKIVSASPELFCSIEDEIVRTMPIKGTAPTGQASQLLMESEKERSELMMIIDLLRNDLHRICCEVEVERAIFSQNYPTLTHLLSSIRGKLKQPLSPVAVLQTLFPGGSISGCPKLAAMEMIYRLERAPRGIYTGSIGFFHGRRGCFNLAIRTASLKAGEMRLRVGGAILAESDPVTEYEETVHKSSVFLQAGESALV